MKKLLSLAMLAAMLLTACVKQENFSDALGDKVNVTFVVNASDIQTKAGTSDFNTGTNADELLVQAFILEDNEYYKTNADDEANLTITKSGDLKWTVDLKLAKNQTYKIAFWAQKSGTGIYDTADLSKVAVDYSKIAVNSDDADAFCAARLVTVTGALSETVYLYRPLAQINLGTNDRTAYLNSVTTEAKKTLWASYTMAAGIPSKLNVIGGETAADGATVGAAVIENTTEAVTYAPVEFLDVTNEILPGYEYIAMAYVLAEPAGSTMDFSAALSSGASADDLTAVNSVTVSSMPFRANYQTNIYGQLLTGTLNYNVEIKPEFNTPAYTAEIVMEGTVTELNQTLEANVANENAQSYDIAMADATGDADNESTITIPEGTAAESLTFVLSGVANGVDTITITDENTADGYQGDIAIEVPANFSLDNVVINTPAAHVTLRQGNYTNVTASTSGSTLIVADNTIVENLIVKSGNVKIAAEGVVTSIDNQTGGTVYVTIGATSCWTNMAAEKGAKLIPMFVLPGMSIDADGAYHLEELAGLVNLRNLVNAGNTFSGYTVYLDADLDMTGVEWTPIGVESYANNFRGVFDGQNHTISNLTVAHAKTAALFGTINSATIKNLKMANVTATSNHYAGGIVAWAEQGGSPVVVDNCSVEGGSITSTPELVGSEYDNGDKVGGIIGFAYCGEYTNNSVSGVTISAYRDLAGVAGYATKATITGNSVSDVTIVQSNINGYKSTIPDTFGAIVGRDGGQNTVENNTESNVSYSQILTDGLEYKDGIYYVSNDNGLHAVPAKVVDGDVIVLADGTYNAGAWLRFSKSVTLKAANEHMAIMDGKTSIDGNKTLVVKDIVFYNQTPYSVPQSVHQYHAKSATAMVSSYDGSIEADNCVFTPTTSDAAVRLYGSNSAEDHLTVKDCSFAGTYSAEFRPIMAQGSVDIQGCTFSGVERYMTQLYGTGGGYATTVTVKDNKVQATPTDAEYSVTNLLSVGSGARLSNVTILVKDNTGLDDEAVAYTYACKNMDLIDSANITYGEGCDEIVWQLQSALENN